MPLTSIQCWHVHCEECWLRTLVRTNSHTCPHTHTLHTHTLLCTTGQLLVTCSYCSLISQSVSFSLAVPHREELKWNIPQMTCSLTTRIRGHTKSWQCKHFQFSVGDGMVPKRPVKNVGIKWSTRTSTEFYTVPRVCTHIQQCCWLLVSLIYSVVCNLLVLMW